MGRDYENNNEHIDLFRDRSRERSKQHTLRKKYYDEPADTYRWYTTIQIIYHICIPRSTETSTSVEITKKTNVEVFSALNKREDVDS
jgi:hypothetical protein